MFEGETNFPRGGKNQRKTSTSEDNKQDEGRPQGEKAKPKVQKEFSRKRQNAEESPFDRPAKKLKPTITNVERPLHFDAICLDLVTLACVREVFLHGIVVDLPGNRTGFIPITNISNVYSELLSHLSMDDDNKEDENVTPVSDLLKPGFFLPVAVKSITEVKVGRPKVICSCKPSDINAATPKSAVHDGMLLMGSVSSVEDHGYRIDTGIKGLHAFLKNADAVKYIAKFCSEEQLPVGQPLWCVVCLKDKKSEVRVVNVTIAPDMIKKAQIQNSQMNCLLPGMKTTVHVKTVGVQGLLVTFGSFEGILHGSHLPSDISAYSVGAAIQATILYVHPESKIIHLSALVEIVKQCGNAVDMFTGIDIGDILEAKILRLVRKKGLFLELPSDMKGFAALNQLRDETEVPDINDFIVGDNVTCRVMGFNHMEGRIVVTLKQSILKEKFITVKSLNAGDMVEAVILDILPSGVFVKISRKIHSFIHMTHMSNVPITQLKKKFETGMVLKCKVTRVDVKKSKVYLTHKAALLKSKLLIPTDYSQLETDAKVMGVISVLKENYLIVRFFNNVQGIVLPSEMGLENDISAQDSFYLGQVVRCRVKYIDTKQEKVELSFNLTRQKKKKNVPEEPAEPLILTPGMVTGAKIIGVSNSAYKVVLMPGNIRAVLPFEHLSDYTEITELRKLILKKFDILSKVAYFSKTQNNTVTMKESFIKSAEDKMFADKFEDLEVGMLLPGVVKNHQDYGFFIELAGGHTGLCPTKTLPRIDKSALHDLYPVGRSLLTRIVAINKEKKRFLCGITKQDCVKDNDSDDMDFFYEYLKSKDAAMKHLFEQDEKLKPYGNVAIGSVVDVTVTSVYKKGVLCDLASGLKAIATHDHLRGVQPESGKLFPAVVLDVDVLSPCLEVSLEPRLCKAITTRKNKEDRSSCVKIGQTLKADLLLLKQEFLVMKLKGHGSGKFVYIPTKKHFNDVYMPTGHKIGMYSNVTIIGDVDGTLIGALKFKDHKSKEESNAKEKGKKEVNQEKENIDVDNLPLHSVQVGDVIEAKVKSVHRLQMNITSDRVNGRVHITEVCDDAIQKKNPLHKYHNGETVKIKVIGLRNMKSNKEYLPISRPQATRTFLECSLKESKMDKTDPKDLLYEELSTFLGEEMTVYVIQVDSSKIWVQASLMHQGSISLFQASQNVSVLNNINKKFRIGQPLKATVVGKSSNEKINFSLIGPEVVPEVGSKVTALITGAKNSELLSVRLCNGSMGVLDTFSKAFVAIGKFIKCKVLCVSSNGVFRLAALEKGNDRKRKRSDSLSEIDEADDKNEIEKNTDSKSDELVQKEMFKQKKKKKASVEEEEIVNPNLLTKIKDEQNLKQSVPATTDKSRLTIQGFSWGGDLRIQPKQKKVVDDDDDDVIGTTVKDGKSRKKMKREEEKVIEEYEKKQLQGTAGPEDVNDFERLVLQSPNSSMVWLGYMAYHLELGEVAKARAVAEKALNTIVFREEQEKKNVWLAYLNLETMYGDTEDLKRLLDRAKVYNDPLEIQLKMCDIYAGANKIEDAEQQYTLLMRKFKKDKSVWKSYAQFLYKQDKAEFARNILKRCLSALEKRDHVEVISRFANLEFSHGNPERGRTMFENLIASYPGRTDIWSVYVDMVVKSGDIADARQLLERAVKQKLNAKKVSFLIQKFIKFEETHGTEDQVQKVKDMAVSLLD